MAKQASQPSRIVKERFSDRNVRLSLHKSTPYILYKWRCLLHIRKPLQFRKMNNGSGVLSWAPLNKFKDIQRRQLLWWWWCRCPTWLATWSKAALCIFEWSGRTSIRAAESYHQGKRHERRLRKDMHSIMLEAMPNSGCGNAVSRKGQGWISLSSTGKLNVYFSELTIKSHPMIHRRAGGLAIHLLSIFDHRNVQDWDLAKHVFLLRWSLMKAETTCSLPKSDSSSLWMGSLLCLLLQLQGCQVAHAKWLHI